VSAAAAPPLVVEVERSGLVESRHQVDVAVAGADGHLVARAGDPETVAYLRSAAKPLQASVCLAAGWRPLGDEELAVACASHDGGPEHVARVREILAEAGLPEEALRCPAAWPARPGDAARAGAPAPVHHNCSGKHAAMLAACAAAGWDLSSYAAPDHPLQRAVARALAELAGREPRAAGVDGCGVPTFALSLAEMAALFARLPGTADRALRAMRAHPLLAGGPGRICTAVAAAPGGAVAKVGAEGLLCAVLPGRGLGLALKARDGGARARGLAALEALRALEVPVEGLDPDPTAVLGGGRPVGRARVRGALRPA
jgi:L-asparaginase II